MVDERDLGARLSLRDSGLRRLKTLTGLLMLAMTALATIFVGIAAGTTPGRKLIHVARTTAGRARTGTTRSTSVPSPPPLPALGSGASQAPAAPAQPPAAVTPASPPAAVSGGS